jgi:4-carboxymuconolactone decarboxylase
MTMTTPQGFGPARGERLPLPPMERMTDAQRAAADRLIAGPRKGVKGPFIPLMHSPVLLDRLAGVGEYLRFESVLPTRINEFITSIVARELSNQFEWAIHHPLALQAGVAASTLQDVAQGARPRAMSEEEADAWDFTTELLHRHGVSDPTYAAAVQRWGERGAVEMSALIGYFACVCWVMNMARTPAPAGASVMNGFPM